MHDASTIAAVIVEPIAGSTGVVLPPQGYLKRLREICDKHGILLIFDEVITGFGRIGSPFAAQEFGVTPDMITCAKGLTNGCVPMGAVLVSKKIYDAFMQGPPGAIELFHGYTYSAHPIACAAGLATLGIYEGEKLLTRAKQIGAAVREGGARAARAAACHRHPQLRAGRGHRARVRSRGRPGARAFDIYLKCFERGLLLRTTGDIIALSPSLIIEPKHIDELFGILSQAIKDSP